VAITIDALTLPVGTIWENRHQSKMIVGAGEHTLDGGIITWEKTILAGFPIDLVSSENSGWITKTDLDTLIGYAEVKNTTYSFIYDSTGENYQATVRFRHEDPPVVAFTPIVAQMTYQNTDYFYGVIKLMSVSE